MKIRIKRISKYAVVPKYAHDYEDACFDLVATSRTYDDYGNTVYGTGLAFEIPEGYCGLVFPRSSNCKKTLLMCNSVGVIDSGYRNEVSVRFKPTMIDGTEYEVGERVAQMMIVPLPHIEFDECDELSGSERGTGGFGSTGK